MSELHREAEVIVTGRHSKGIGRAHVANKTHEIYFGCPMFGTFNVRTNVDIDKFAPTIERDGFRYWRLIIDGKHEAWAFRWNGSRQSTRKWELVSKELLPDSLRYGTISMEIS